MSQDSHEIHCYVGLCRGLATLAAKRSQRHPVPSEHQIAKIGTSNGAVDDRLAEVGADRYGAAIVVPSGGAVVEDGFERWVAGTIMPTRAPKHRAIEVHPRSISIVLPVSVTARCFDAALRRALRSRALDYSRNEPPRMTLYRIGAKERLSVARELYRYAHRSRSDADALLTAIESAVDALQIDA